MYKRQIFFRFAFKAGFLAEDPGRLIRRAVTGTPPPRTLSEDERAKLLETLAEKTGPEAERDHALFTLMLVTGIRLSSAIALDVNDVDLDRAEIRLRHTKGDRPATVFLNDSIREHLARYLHGMDAGPLFRAKHGGRVSVRHAQRRFRELVEKAGIERTASTVTKSAASPARGSSPVRPQVARSGSFTTCVARRFGNSSGLTCRAASLRKSRGTRRRACIVATRS